MLVSAIVQLYFNWFCFTLFERLMAMNVTAKQHEIEIGAGENAVVYNDALGAHIVISRHLGLLRYSSVIVVGIRRSYYVVFHNLSYPDIQVYLDTVVYQQQGLEEVITQSYSWYLTPPTLHIIRETGGSEV